VRGQVAEALGAATGGPMNVSRHQAPLRCTTRWLPRLEPVAPALDPVPPAPAGAVLLGFVRPGRGSSLCAAMADLVTSSKGVHVGQVTVRSTISFLQGPCPSTIASGSASARSGKAACALCRLCTVGGRRPSPRVSAPVGCLAVSRPCTDTWSAFLYIVVSRFGARVPGPSSSRLSSATPAPHHRWRLGGQEPLRSPPQPLRDVIAMGAMPAPSDCYSWLASLACHTTLWAGSYRHMKYG
jgi:hypothetical protein